MPAPPPTGITPPAPGLQREEPDFWLEDDIPTDDGGPAGGEVLPERKDEAQPK